MGSPENACYAVHGNTECRGNQMLRITDQKMIHGTIFLSARR
jgi:hypothetical protein